MVTSMQLGIPEGLLESLCYVETKHDVSAIAYFDGKTHSYGICQIKYKTAKSLGFKGSEEELMIPKNNIYYAGKFLAYQHKRYKNWTKAVIAYNRGNAKGLTNSAYSVKVFKQWKGSKYVSAY